MPGNIAQHCVFTPSNADEGTFYIRVRKIGGTSTAGYVYSLYMHH